MRLLAIRLRNLNSLSGVPHEVRFDVGPLAQAGVFLITGPTGAGKSTLLDAITLALYGRAARYGNEKADEMMSRHTAECQAEVDFEAQGQRLRATWRLRRARGKIEGSLQPVERRLSRADTGEILAEKSREIDQMVEDLTGLDCQRFLRSVLLAQGQFAAFLKAKPNERAELLEKITGTGIYSELSVLAYQTYDEKQKEVARLKDRLGALDIMADEERTEKERQVSEQQAASQRLQADHSSALKSLNDLKLLQESQRQHSKVVAEIARGTEALEKLAKQQAAAEDSHRQAQFAVEAQRNSRAAREPIWEKAAQLMAKLQTFDAQLTESRNTYREHAANHKSAENLRSQKEKVLENYDRDSAAIDEWLSQHQDDARLSEQVSSLRAALSLWRNAYQVLQDGERLHADRQSLSKQQSGLQATEGELKSQLETARQRLAAQAADLERAAATCEQQRGLVAHAQNVASLEDHRQDLKHGEACPLCGATEHPYAAGGINFVSQLQAARQLLQQLERQRDLLQRTQAATEQEAARTEAKLEAVSKQLAEVATALCARQAPDDAALHGLRLDEAGKRLDVAPTPDEAELAIVALERRAQTYADKSAQAMSRQTQRQRLEADLQLAWQDVAARSKRLDELRTEGVKLKDITDAAAKELSGLLGERSLDADRQWHTQQVLAAEQTLRQCEALSYELRSRGAAAKATLDQQRIQERELAAKAEGQPAVAETALADAQAAADEAANKLTATQQNIGRLIEALRRDDATRQQRENGQGEVDAATAEATRWGRLRELIGSADGARFARFAQSLTLRQLACLANQHLQGLTPRYRLMAASGDELDLRIVDLYQAGVDRPMESLSGGESFLASLALALGLSELASRHHPIDSLFIDEGFGTLDGDTLETAMAALENLQGHGKSIGVISHVEAMKERISTQIRVTKLEGGCSRIEVTS